MRVLEHFLAVLPLAAAARGQDPATPEAIEALSRQARGALAARQLDQAESCAGQTRKLDAERLLALVDRRGIVRLYRAGPMSLEELATAVASAFAK